MLRCGDKIGIVCCSNGQKHTYKEKINQLESTLEVIGLHPVFSDCIYEKNDVFSGTAKEAIEMFPTKVNVTVAAARASVGPERMNVRMQSTPYFRGDTQRVEIRNPQVRAIIDVYSATAEIAAWSVVSTLRNISSPIVFV